MTRRSQRTIARPVAVAGVGFLGGADVTLRFLPAPPDHGVCFRRVDLPGTRSVPARVEYTVPRQRRTAIERDGVTVELVEHVMAALFALQVDNCLVELDAPEPPGGDGSSQMFAEALLSAGMISQGVPRHAVRMAHSFVVGDHAQRIAGSPQDRDAFTIRYELDYGEKSPIQRQFCEIDVTPESFLSEIVFARTFVLEQEALALRAQGYGRRTTARDLLIFGPAGVIDNALRAPNECARHKLLDCIGDFALAGCDLSGRIEAFRSGHQLNSDFVRRLKQTHAAEFWPEPVSRAA